MEKIEAYQKIKISYKQLNKCYKDYKISVTKSAYSKVWVECTRIEKDLDELQLFKITDCYRDELHKLRKLMLKRIASLESKVKKKYDNLKN